MLLIHTLVMQTQMNVKLWSIDAELALCTNFDQVEVGFNSKLWAFKSTFKWKFQEVKFGARDENI